MEQRKSVRGYLSYSMICFSYFFASGIFASMLSVYLTGLDKTSKEISFIVSASGIFTMVMGPLIGMAYDRTGRRRDLSILLLAASSLSGILFAFTQTTAYLFLLNGLAMAFLNSVNPVCEQIASSSPYRYGVIRLWGAVGYAAASQFAGVILDYSPPAVLFILFAIAVLLTGVAFQCAGLTNIEQAKNNKKKSQKGSLNLPLIFFAVFCFFFSGITGTGNVYVPLLLKELLGGTSVVGTILFLGTLTEIPLIFLSNKFMDQLTGKHLLIVNTLLLILQYLTYTFSKSAILTCVVLILTKSTTTMLFIMVTLKVVLNLTGGEGTTTALSVIATVKSLGSVILTNLAGKLIDDSDIHTAFLRLLEISLVLMGVSILVKLPEKDRKYFSGG